MNKGNDKHKVSVLLIEQNPSITADIQKWLHHTQVTHASTKEEIFHQLHSQRWDLIITDIQFPDLTDVDITRIAKEIDHTVGILIVTQHQKINFILEALKHHADGLQFKPLDKNEFIETCNNILKEVRTRRRHQKNIILAIGAHPDDVEIGCGGALSKHQSNGDAIHILTLTFGEKGGEALIRKNEAIEAAKFQGAELHFGNLTDTEISAGVDTISVIEQTIEKVKPTHIYTHSVHDSHNDHRNVHYASLSGSRAIPNLYCYQSPSSTVHFIPNMFVEIKSQDLERKIQAVMLYKSQYEIRPYLHENVIRTNANYWSRFCNFQLAEPMEVLKRWSI